MSNTLAASDIENFLQVSIISSDPGSLFRYFHEVACASIVKPFGIYEMNNGDHVTAMKMGAVSLGNIALGIYYGESANIVRHFECGENSKVHAAFAALTFGKPKADGQSVEDTKVSNIRLNYSGGGNGYRVWSLPYNFLPSVQIYVGDYNFVPFEKGYKVCNSGDLSFSNMMSSLRKDEYHNSKINSVREIYIGVGNTKKTIEKFLTTHSLP